MRIFDNLESADHLERPLTRVALSHFYSITHTQIQPTRLIQLP